MPASLLFIVLFYHLELITLRLWAGSVSPALIPWQNILDGNVWPQEG